MRQWFGRVVKHVQAYPGMSKHACRIHQTGYNVQIVITRKIFLQYVTKDVNSVNNFLLIIGITLLFIGIVFYFLRNFDKFIDQSLREMARHGILIAFYITCPLTVIICRLYLYYNILILCVWPPFCSTLWHDKNSRPVSLEPVWPEEYPWKKIFRKVTNDQITEKMCYQCFSMGKFCFQKHSAYSLQEL